MPTQTKYGRWKAKVKLDGLEHYCGSFPTRADAAAAEDQFRADNAKLIDYIRADHSYRTRMGVRPYWERKRAERPI